MFTHFDSSADPTSDDPSWPAPLMARAGPQVADPDQARLRAAMPGVFHREKKP